MHSADLQACASHRRIKPIGNSLNPIPAQTSAELFFITGRQDWPFLSIGFGALSSHESGTPIVDIGGDEGKLLRKVLELNPEMRGSVLDMPATIETANQELSDDTCGGRCSHIAGDFFESVPPGADAYLLCGVVHDWDDNRVIAILRNCRRAMTKNGRLLLVDMILRDTEASSQYPNLRQNSASFKLNYGLPYHLQLDVDAP
jgi:O-methyltransferase domain